MEVKNEKLMEYPSGAKRSDRTGKGRYDLISPHMLKRLAMVYEQGAAQKGARNWEGGFPISRCIDSALRHIAQYMTGLTDEDHIAQAVWQLAAIIHFEEEIKNGNLPCDLQDLPSRQSTLPEFTTNANADEQVWGHEFMKQCVETLREPNGKTKAEIIADMVKNGVPPIKENIGGKQV